MTTKIPQPQGMPLFGNLDQLESTVLVASFGRLHKLYGDIFRLTVINNKQVMLCNYEFANFVSDESKFDKTTRGGLLELRHATGDGLFTADTYEPNWQLAHKILIPAFGPLAIRDMFPEMMDLASQLILRWERFAGEEIDVCDSFTRLTLDTIALCSFNYRFNSFYHEKMHPFVTAMVYVLHQTTVRFLRPTIQNTLMFNTNRRFHEDIAYMHQLCDEIVKERRDHPNDVNDLLNRMINGKDPETGYQLCDENIRYQMVTFLIAGHETTSGSLSFAFYYLLKNPRTLEKARAEADQCEELTIDSLNKLEYIDAVMKETLRLQPPLPAISLKTKADKVTLPGGYEVVKDDIIAVLLHHVHRDPKVWDRPEEFLPERMLNGGFENLPPNAWKPFGNGQRSCIGRGFAIQESVIVATLILKHFHIEFVDPSYDLRIKETATIKPDGFKMRVRSRQRIQLLPNLTIKQSDQTPYRTEQQQQQQQQQQPDGSNLRPMVILFGSNSGSCESFAGILASEAPTHGFNAISAPLDSAVGSLPSDRPIIIVTSTYEGKPCDNAKQFVAYLETKPEIKTNYAVFGAGHHDWVNTYQKIPKFIDEMLSQLGGTRTIDRGVGDSAGDFFGTFEAWKENLFQQLQKNAGVQNVTTEEKVSIEIVHSTRHRGQIVDVGTVKENRLLVEASELGPAKRHLEIELPKGQTYRAGDYLSVLPMNPLDYVHRIFTRFNLPLDTKIKIRSSTDTFLPSGQRVSALEILSGYVELNQPISRKQIDKLAALCKDETEQKQLTSLGGDAYQTEILDKHCSILDVLEMYPSCDLSFPDYLRMLPSLRTRQYSISSSPLWNSEVITLTIDVLNAPAMSGRGRYYGVASNYLANLKEGDHINCSVRTSNVNFHLPVDLKTPVVMFAAGTGIAPFHGFIQERAAQFACGRKVGPTILYYGCRSQEDFLYYNELENWSKLGVVQVKSIFSRQSNENRKYVQHLIWEDREEIGKLFKQGAQLYTCGSAKKLGQSVKTCFLKIIAGSQQCNEEQATEIFEKTSLNRYSVDVFA